MSDRFWPIPAAQMINRWQAAADPFQPVAILYSGPQFMRFSIPKLVSSILLASWCTADAAPDGSCAITTEKWQRVLELSFAEFDQTEDSGWRPYYSLECYSIAADLLVTYIERHPDRSSENYVLPFHAGQMLAMAGDYGDSIRYLKRSYSDRESKLIDWNAFVDAHIAFIEKDAEKLARMRERIDQQPEMRSGPGVPEWAVGRKINLDVVDGFLACFDEPFAIAYEMSCRPNRQD